jgi:hypothetical protein
MTKDYAKLGQQVAQASASKYKTYRKQGYNHKEAEEKLHRWSIRKGKRVGLW